MTPKISKHFMTVCGKRLAYVDQGRGLPLIFLHGNPTSSFLWRNVMAPLTERYRCIAPDLIGMGDSDKLSSSSDDAYSFFEHRRYLDALLEGLRLETTALLVVHDWGSALGMDWVRRHSERVRGLAYMEAIVGVREWADMPQPAQQAFRALRSSQGEELVLTHNFFVEKILPGGVLRALDAEELEEYRRPFRESGEGRRPTLAWPRQLPIAGEPREVCELVASYTGFLERSSLPKLFVNAEPGRILVGALRDACRRWPNQREVTVKGLHFLQEDSPVEIAAALGAFADEVS
jgi:haloalkane dehalogenase